jgi:CHAT domain-containing protein
VLVAALFRELARDEGAGVRTDYALALVRAKREVRSRPGWSDPFYWAAFVLEGSR